MIAFILNLALMISLGAILFLVARALPRVVEDPDENGKNGRFSVFEKWIASEMPERVDEFLSNVLMKTLRRMKIFLLKADNNLSKHLKKIKPQLNKEETNGGFKDITEEGQEGSV